MARNNTWEVTFTRTVIETSTTVITADSQMKAQELAQKAADLMNGGLKVYDKGDNQISFSEEDKKYSEITVESAKQKW